LRECSINSGMNKDAAVYKIFAELGIDFDHEVPDPKEVTQADRAINPEDTFLDAVEDLFTDSSK